MNVGETLINVSICCKCFDREIEFTKKSNGKEVSDLVLKVNELHDEIIMWEKLVGKRVDTKEFEEVRRELRSKIGE